jgi:adenylylsulfate kinase
MTNTTHIVWHPHAVTRADREAANGHRGCVVWFTGLSGCGKSTVANAVDRWLFAHQIRTVLLDGDNVRHGLNAPPEILAAEYDAAFAKRFGLTFAAEDRQENIRRIGCVAELFAATGLITLTAFVSPYRRDRDAVRKLVEKNGQTGDFVEVFVDAPLEVCEKRDPKGLYQKARAGLIPDFTGISAPYEPPTHPELRLDASGAAPEVLALQVVAFLTNSGKIPPQHAKED